MTQPTKWCAPSEDSAQAGHLPSLIGVFAVRMKKHWVLSYPLSTQRRLWSNWAHSHFVDLSCRASPNWSSLLQSFNFKWDNKTNDCFILPYCLLAHITNVENTFYALNFEEVDCAYWFRVFIRLSIRQEPCMLGFWNFMWIPHGKIADTHFFFVWVIFLSGVMPLWKHQNEILSARYLEKYLS